MQGRRCSASPQSRLISREESSSPIIPVASANVHGNHQSGQYANAGPSPSYRGQSKRQANRSSIASSASNTGAGSLDLQPEERLDQQPSVETKVQRLQSMTLEMLEEEFGQLGAATLKDLFDASHWCKDKINKSSNARDKLLGVIGERERSEPSGSGRCGCYYCYEMYGKERFCKEQTAYAILKANGNYKPLNERRKYPESTNIENLRRFCMECGVRLHFYRRYRRFCTDSSSGPDWWVCRCRVLRPVVDEEEPCPDCNCVCPLRNPDEDDDTFESDDSDGSDA
ncbi:hypothetical protein CKAH01_14801 [Colletotrichum kahawae]|uniref:Uncharacterized protein n=1 Tax=Colletotrichum kahawae TaxID=34407 RepID=A0AAD9YL08_COLKA|nr:hypothetical protein CKAH01_14801 [Colletotrichum kahawae]